MKRLAAFYILYLRTQKTIIRIATIAKAPKMQGSTMIKIFGFESDTGMLTSSGILQKQSFGFLQSVLLEEQNSLQLQRGESGIDGVDGIDWQIGLTVQFDDKKPKAIMPLLL